MIHFVDNVSTEIVDVRLRVVNSKVTNILHGWVHGQEDISDVSVIFILSQSHLQSLAYLLGLQIFGTICEVLCSHQVVIKQLQEVLSIYNKLIERHFYKRIVHKIIL